MGRCDDQKDVLEEFFVKRYSQEDFDRFYPSIQCVKGGSLYSDGLSRNLERIEIYVQHCKVN